MPLTLLLLAFSSPAYAAPPVILRPTNELARDGISTTEGDALVILFVVYEPDNDVVTYSVEYLVEG